jgi:hypothetical protein
MRNRIPDAQAALLFRVEFVHFLSLRSLNNVLRYSKWNVNNKNKKKKEAARERGQAQNL